MKRVDAHRPCSLGHHNEYRVRVSMTRRGARSRESWVSRCLVRAGRRRLRDESVWSMPRVHHLRVRGPIWLRPVYATASDQRQGGAVSCRRRSQPARSVSASVATAWTAVLGRAYERGDRFLDTSSALEANRHRCVATARARAGDPAQPERLQASARAQIFTEPVDPCRHCDRSRGRGTPAVRVSREGTAE